MVDWATHLSECAQRSIRATDSLRGSSIVGYEWVDEDTEVETSRWSVRRCTWQTISHLHRNSWSVVGSLQDCKGYPTEVSANSAWGQQQNSHRLTLHPISLPHKLSQTQRIPRHGRRSLQERCSHPLLIQEYWLKMTAASKRPATMCTY